MEEQHKDSTILQDNNNRKISGYAGKLKLFIGAAPGVGKTYTMLREANALKARGVDVVIGYVDVHNRTETAAQTKGLEIIPRKQLKFHGHVFEEIDMEAVIACRPEMVVIDELAHSNVPGSKHAKRYMDVEYLLNHGINVMTAVNVQHIENVHEEAQEITGIKVREIIPKSFVKRADEVEVIDVPPETLRQRLRDGSIYPREKVEQALNNFFRKSNLSALRELALREVADDVDERLQRSFERNKIPGPVGAKGTILVCVNYTQRSRRLIHKGSRLAERMKGDLLVLTILDCPEEELDPKKTQALELIKTISDKYEADLIIEQYNDRKLGEVIIQVAERLNVTQIVIGQSKDPRKWGFFHSNPLHFLLRHMKYVDLHIIGWKEEKRTSATTAVMTESTAVNQPAHEKNRTEGRLTIYTGASPGVGKTYKMLQDANDLLAKGIDVVIGVIETHGRADTTAQIGQLEMLPQKVIHLEGHDYQELDVEGIIRRKPEIVLIDELAHTNVPGSQREKRYQDIQFILEHGIHVITAVNIQHLESLRDKIEHITGVKVRERVPDWFMDLAWQVKLIDITPEALQQRLIDGKIYTHDKIERALNNFFRITNLTALREIALLEVADDVDQRLDRQRLLERGKIKKRNLKPGGQILVCVNYRPHSEKLIRRGWRIADRSKAQLYVLVVIAEEAMTEIERRDLERIRQLSEQFDAIFLTRSADRKGVGGTIVQMADELHVSQIVIGQPLPTKGWLAKFTSNPVDYVLENAEFVNLYVVANTRD